MTQATTAADTKLFWLASYPKTGSTWLREILTNIVAPDNGDRNAVIASFQKAWPENASTHPIQTIWGEPLTMIKTHLYPGHKRMETVPYATAGIITIRRHPLDILLSALNYAHLKEMQSVFLNETSKPVEQIIEAGEFSHYIDSFKANDGFLWFAGPSGALSTYMQRWRSFGADNRYFEICYEDLFANPEEGIGDLLEFLEISVTDAKIAEIYKVADKRTQENDRFFWKRRAYNFQELLTPELIDEFHEKCAFQLEALGYPLKA